VTVAVIGDDAKGDVSAYLMRSSGDFRVEWFNGTVKAGGQHHQKNANCCRLTHLPTGIVKTAQTRSRDNSQRLAQAAMEVELDRMVAEGNGRAVNGVRRAQVGSGMRGDKRRTYRFQEDTVTDHASGRRARASDVMAGRFDLLWA
jgi:peptide chain release factor 1